MKDKFKKVEAKLYNYKQTKAEINILKRELETLENNYEVGSAITYSERTSATNAFNSSVENEIVRREKSIKSLKGKIRLKEIEIENIDDAIKTLNEDEVILINERYFNKKTNKYVAAVLNVTEDTASRYKNNAINKLINLLS